MDAQEQEQDSGPLTVVLGCWTVVLEQVPPEGGGGHPTLKVDVRLGKGLGQASPAQVLIRRVVEEDEELAGPSCVKAKEATSPVVEREEGVDHHGETVRAEPTITPTTATQRADDAALSGLHINDLPQEVQQHILSFLGPADLVLRAGLTSQHWRRLTEDAAMWRALHAKIFGGPPVPPTRLKMSGRAPVSWFQSFRYLFKGQRNAQSEQQQALAAKRDALQAALAHEQRQWELRKRKHENSLSIITDALNSQYAQESLRHACKYGSIVVVRRILEESRDLLNASLNFRSQTALTIAARYGQAEVVRYLLDLGAEADDHALSLAVDKGHNEVARLLISRGVDPKDNPEVLSRAVLQNNVTLAQLLLDHGAGQHVNVVSGTGTRVSLPLHVAVTKGHHEMVKLLLAHGADPRLQSRDGRSAVDLAQSNGAILATLLEHEQQAPATATLH